VKAYKEKGPYPAPDGETKQSEWRKKNTGWAPSSKKKKKLKHSGKGSDSFRRDSPTPSPREGEPTCKQGNLAQY